MHESECDIPVPEIFCFFTSVPESFSTKKVLEPVPEKFGTKKRDWMVNIFFDKCFQRKK